MALLDIITPEVIAERFYTLPEKLQGALENQDNQLAVQIACAMNGVGDPDELQNAEAIMAAVILGLTHMDELKETLAENLGIDLQAATKIAAEVRTKVLEPLRKDIEKIYAPIQDPVAKTMGVPIAPPVPMPAPLPVTPKAVPAPTVPPKAAPAVPPWQPTRLAIPTGPAQPMPAAPAPFMMQQESSAAPLATGADFRLNIPTDIFRSAQTKKVDIPRPPKAAELEIGKAPLAPKPPGNVSFRAAPTAQSRVVHYTDLQTTITPGFAAPQPPPPAAKGAPPSAPTAPAPKPSASSAPSVPPAAPARTDVKPIVTPIVPAAPTPLTPAVLPATPTPPVTPAPPKPPKVVNFGPEEVK